MTSWEWNSISNIRSAVEHQRRSEAGGAVSLSRALHIEDAFLVHAFTALI